MSAPLNEGAAPERTRGRQVESQANFAKQSAKTQVLNAAAQYVANHAMIAASVCLHLCAGRSPEQVAADIAGRAVKALKGKGKRP